MNIVPASTVDDGSAVPHQKSWGAQHQLLPLGKGPDAWTLGQGLALSARLMCSSLCTRACVVINMGKWGYREPGVKKYSIHSSNFFCIFIQSKYMYGEPSM